MIWSSTSEKRHNNSLWSITVFILYLFYSVINPFEGFAKKQQQLIGNRNNLGWRGKLRGVFVAFLHIMGFLLFAEWFIITFFIVPLPLSCIAFFTLPVLGMWWNLFKFF